MSKSKVERAFLCLALAEAISCYRHIKAHLYDKRSAKQDSNTQQGEDNEAHNKGDLRSLVDFLDDDETGD